MTKTMKASECKAKFLAVIDEVAATGESVVVTKNGKPVGRIVPHVARPATPYGALEGSVVFHDALAGPTYEDHDDRTAEKWERIHAEAAAGHQRAAVAGHPSRQSRSKSSRTVRRRVS
jgi:prevent-host-death family protein